MHGALDGLPGIIEITVDLGRGAFTVTYDPAHLTRAEVQEAIQELGFTPRFLEAGASLDPLPDGNSPATDPGLPFTGSHPALPAPIDKAAVAARLEQKFLLVDFTADWCAPCRVIESVVLPDQRVQAALTDYILVRVDADADAEAEAVRDFHVVAMPTLLILDDAGREITRLVGPVNAERLAEELVRARADR